MKPDQREKGQTVRRKREGLQCQKQTGPTERGGTGSTRSRVNPRGAGKGNPKKKGKKKNGGQEEHTEIKGGNG